jgi:hypothetical protein
MALFNTLKGTFAAKPRSLRVTGMMETIWLTLKASGVSLVAA